MEASIKNLTEKRATKDDNYEAPLFCSFCGRTNKDGKALKRCSRCKSAYFCDTDCLSSAWKSFHKYDCSRPPLSFEDQIELEILQSELSKAENRHVYKFSHPVPLGLLLRAVERNWQKETTST
uniref:MYND-type domain-containing protein n=1 Tax=Aplanochytrium stocchinoi TaxID=215587 RepID=A0A7S3PM83_9STRA|mmetsp:Transcript_13879/g.17222  ORF Transcript_13879/g.17222 Transcript_13879/m.17222 type:complete len:123 (-) Transcript_13879:28-396(-)